MQDVVRTLAHDSLQGRSVGTEFEKKSLSIISEKFYALTHKRLRKNTFGFVLDTKKIQSVNGYCFLNNRKKETIILSAHYDHIGLGGELSMSRKNNQVHNGADDNASGVALLLALSESLSKQKSNKYNFLVVFYSAHEVGLFGSKYFSEFVFKNSNKFKPIVCAINFDMVGRLDPQLKKLKCMRTANAEKLFDTLNSAPFGFELNFIDSEKLLFLDTKYYVENEIPAINFTTGLHLDYHAVTDDYLHINFDGMFQIHQFLLSILKCPSRQE